MRESTIYSKGDLCYEEPESKPSFQGTLLEDDTLDHSRDYHMSIHPVYDS